MAGCSSRACGWAAVAATHHEPRRGRRQPIGSPSRRSAALRAVSGLCTFLCPYIPTGGRVPRVVDGTRAPVRQSQGEHWVRGRCPASEPGDAAGDGRRGSDVAKLSDIRGAAGTGLQRHEPLQINALEVSSRLDLSVPCNMFEVRTTEF